jgi:hypothetical protein
MEHEPKFFLSATELAARLGVHSSTIHKRKLKEDFSQYTRSRDPQGLSWQYDAERKKFSENGGWQRFVNFTVISPSKPYPN